MAVVDVGAYDAHERARPQWWSALEATVLFGLIVLYIWWLQASFRPFWLVLLALVVASHVRRGETPRSLGFGRDNLWSCLAAVAPVLGVGLALALALAVALDTLAPIAPVRIVRFVVYYCVWGLFQQYVLNGYFVNRFAEAVPRGRAYLVPPLAALCFALAHIPNWFLVGVTLCAGWLCAHIYLRHRNLYPLGVAHGLLGAALFVAAPEAVGQHFYVGPGLVRWQDVQRERAGAYVACLMATRPGDGGGRRALRSGCGEDPQLALWRNGGVPRR